MAPGPFLSRRLPQSSPPFDARTLFHCSTRAPCGLPRRVAPRAARPSRPLAQALRGAAHCGAMALHHFSSAAVLSTRNLCPGWGNQSSVVRYIVRLATPNRYRHPWCYPRQRSGRRHARPAAGGGAGVGALQAKPPRLLLESKAAKATSGTWRCAKVALHLGPAHKDPGTPGTWGSIAKSPARGLRLSNDVVGLLARRCTAYGRRDGAAPLERSAAGGRVRGRVTTRCLGEGQASHCRAKGSAVR